ncbi:hypothetical protein T08_10959 [Trichinella sp. T8]|nr:hypothetical protein T08_10959 [Trichinella sp. T8]
MLKYLSSKKKGLTVLQNFKFLSTNKIVTIF